jgi:hypothetical protein
MTSPQLVAFQQNLQANTLTDDERGALLVALNAFLAEFPQPDDLANASAFMPAIQQTWVSALFAIQGDGGTPVPPPSGDVTDVTGAAPIVVTTPTAGVKNVAITPATDAEAGSMSAADKAKLDALPATGAIVAATWSALSAIAVAALPNGQPANVASVGAAYALTAKGGLTVDGNTVLASTDATRVWQRGATLIGPEAIAQSTWLINGTSGSDEDTGLSGHPIKTWGELIRRWGTAEPELVATQVTIDGPTAAGDAIIATPGKGLLLVAGVQTNGAAGTATFTAKDKTLGTSAALATMTDAAHGAWAIGTLVHAGGAGFVVVADLGSGVAAISQPLALPIGVGAASVDLTGSHTYQIVQNPTAVAASLGNPTQGIVECQTLDLDPNFGEVGMGIVFCAECTLKSGGIFNANSPTSLSPPTLLGCVMGSPSGTAAIGGKYTILAGASIVPGNDLSDQSVIDQDTVVLFRMHGTGTITQGSVYWGEWWSSSLGVELTRVHVLQPTESGEQATQYGPADIELHGAQQVLIVGDTAANTLKLGGTWSFNTSTDGFVFNPTGAVWAGPFTIDASNIDGFGGLQNPTTGCRIIFGT